jgi:CheY-like chemotaxis protein
MPRGGTLSIATRLTGHETVRNRFPLAEASTYVEIRASDNGEGMDETTKRRIFEPFFSTKEPGRGTGLGMAVVFGIIESHRGFIHVDSHPGRGSTFTVYIPVLPAAAEQPEPAESGAGEAPAGTETILVVEDEESLSGLLRMSLEGAGYRVLSASDGQAALETFRSHRNEISLVISDVGLPKMSGDQVFHAMKQLDPGVRTILASGYIEPELKADVLRAGVRAFVQKPYDTRTVLAEVRQVLDAG